jgi:DNA-binding GntR family transcriptional regulator
MDAAAPTLAEQIRQKIADDIVRGVLVPGMPLEEAEIARAFGVSRTPVREAIRQLEAEGFAHARPRRGAVVATIEPARLAEMFQVMADLEALCAERAAQAMTPDERRELQRLLDACGGAVEAGDVEGYKRANEAFHDAIYRGTHNGYLAELTVTVRRRVQPFRRAQFYTFGRLQRSHGEHAEIVAAIVAGAADTAAAAAHRHIATVERVVEEVAYPRRSAAV